MNKVFCDLRRSSAAVRDYHMYNCISIIFKFQHDGVYRQEGFSPAGDMVPIRLYT